jgi:surfeit locus 1 family protein
MGNRKLRIKIIFSTFVAIIGVLVLIRLGIWQLDRLEWRREFNSQFLGQRKLADLDLNQNVENPILKDSDYRKGHASGKFDFDHQVFLQNQALDNVPGYHVLTPFVLQDTSYAVLVDRGWIAMDDLNNLGEIDKPAVEIERVQGVIRIGEIENSFGMDPDLANTDTSKFWLLVNIDKIQNQMPYRLLPVYLQMDANPNGGLPVTQIAEPEISEGPHMSYAIQWFFFASLLGFGYPFFVKKLIKDETGHANLKEKNDDDN